jgi:hypothetical protein
MALVGSFAAFRAYPEPFGLIFLGTIGAIVVGILWITRVRRARAQRF